MSNKTDNLNLYLSNMEDMDKWKNDNINYDIIDDSIYELQKLSGITETVNIYNNIEFIGALDTTKQHMILNGQLVKNPLFNQTIKELTICENISLEDLNESHFGVTKEITFDKRLSKIHSLSNKTIDFNNFKLKVNSNICIRDLILENVNGIKLNGSVVVLANLIFNNLTSSIEGTYYNLIANETLGTNYKVLSGQLNTTSLRNITISKFTSNFSLFKNISNINNLDILLTNDEVTNSNVIFEGVNNVKNCTINYGGANKTFNGIALTGVSFWDTKYKYDGDLYETIINGKGLYNSSNIKTTNSTIALNSISDYITSEFNNRTLKNTLMFLSNIDLNIIDTPGTFEFGNNIKIRTESDDIEFIKCINANTVLD